MNIKKIISFILILSMLLPAYCISTAAAGTPTITVGVAEAVAGETVDIPVSFMNNPGINAFVLGFEYDETRLSLDGVTLNDAMGGDFEYLTKAVWLGENDVTLNGQFLTLHFTVLEGAKAGDARIAVTYEDGDICNYEEDSVDFAAIAGKVTIPTAQFAVSSVTAAAGSKASVTVDIVNNPGINAFVLGIDYDETRLSLNGAEVNPALGGQFEFCTNAVWLAEENSKFNGTAFTLDFTVLPTAPAGDAYVTVTYSDGDVCNYNEDSIDFEVVAGKVTVPAAEIVVSEATAKVGEKATLNVDFVNNPGINAFVLGFEYDEESLQLDSVKINSALGGQFEYCTNAVWLAEKDSKFNGTALTLSFTVLPGAQGSLPVTVTYADGDICNYNEDSIGFAVTAGAVNVPAPELKVSKLDANLGETVSVDVEMLNNPGINAFVLGFDYDETRLSLVNVEFTDKLGGEYESYENKAAWVNGTDVTYEGKLFTLTFEVPADAPTGKADVTVTYSDGDICNYNEQSINFEVTAGCVDVLDPTAPTIILSDVTARAGDTAEIAVSLENNPGINAFILDVDYDEDVMTLTDVKLEKAMGANACCSENAVAWANGEDVTADGKIMTLCFTVSDKAKEGDYEVTLSYKEGNICNFDEEDVDFAVNSAYLTVSHAVKFLRGDVDCNGKVDAKDANLLKQKVIGNANLSEAGLLAADLDYDGKITAKDMLIHKEILMGRAT